MYSSKRYALLNRWDPRHLERVNDVLDPREGERVLEVGCGVGHLTKRLRENGVDAIGVDTNPHAADHAVTEAVATMRAEALGFEDASFDKVVSVHAIEHIPEIAGAFAEMARVLRPGGKMMLIYPAEPIQGLWAVPTAVILHNNPFKAQEVHCHWLWPSKVRRIAKPLGLEELHREFNLVSTPQFISLFQRS